MQFTTEHRRGYTVVGLTGRLDLAEAPQVREVVAEIVAGGVRRVVLDLGGIAFMDSSGLGALIGCLKIARHAGGDLRIARAGPRLQMVLELTSMHRVLPPYESPEKAFDDD
ncbi:anti-anti-sigma factor [Kocuria rosea]|uniref:STAS domain-containing protein n=1 Tax=Kocuria rosea TaxID=1275 RepID=UPI000D6541BE|nr:STAS domain-containing protein [Kocuria rosea]MEB2528518.1 STAS domain-containing protein [Kocuria rosea]MEB2619390.1 STAS domain-containing protein [Kocuria rosea]PWF82117.1 anti-anti-sigma factor [Kocuria rosea]QCY31743.1 anti-sigma factor antagonist [Kocuria rosea]TQN39167.1 anti-sigma B factor antagonist [Kocuria rosea]